MLETKKCQCDNILSNIIEKLLASVSLRLKFYRQSHVKEEKQNTLWVGKVIGSNPAKVDNKNK